MNQYPKVSVVIPVHNCAATLEQTLTMLKQQDYQGETEIIAVDNNSKDGSDKIAQQMSNVILVYQTAIQNAAATRNKGIETATGEIIAFLDGDCIPEKDWIRQAVNIIEQTGVSRIGGRIGVKPISPESPVPALLDTLCCFNQEGAVKNCQSSMTANLIVKREVFDKVGNFNEDYFEMEDIEFGLRATNANFTVSYGKNCLVWHPPRMTVKEMFIKAKRNGKGTFILCNKNPKWSGKWGWKHSLRGLKTLLKPKQLYWDTLPFNPQKISLIKKIQIYFSLLLIMNLGEAVGYWETWFKTLFQKEENNVKNTNCVSL